MDNLFAAYNSAWGRGGDFGSYRGGFPLGLGEDDIEEVICGGDWGDGLETTGRHRWSRSRLFSFRLLVPDWEVIGHALSHVHRTVRYLSVSSRRRTRGRCAAVREARNLDACPTIDGKCFIGRPGRSWSWELAVWWESANVVTVMRRYCCHG